MAFDADDLKNKGKDELSEHRDDAERLAREKLGGTNQRDTDAQGDGGGGTNMSAADTDTSDMRDDFTRRRDETDEGMDYDEVA